MNPLLQGGGAMLTPPRLDLTAHATWRRAHERGLVSDGEWAEYQRLVYTSPVSWLGWYNELGQMKGVMK